MTNKIRRGQTPGPMNGAGPFCFFLGVCILVNPCVIRASEIVEESKTRAIVREHPKTGRPFVSIVPAESPDPPDPFEKQRIWKSRPDYRMLDPKMKSGEIPYEGPYSDKKKIYLFAASLMAAGTVSGLAVIAAAPAATGAGASAGAGAYAAAGTAVAGEAAVIAVKSNPKPKNEDYIHKSGSREEIPDTPDVDKDCKAGSQEVCEENI